nr:hypothetical protein [uncultured Lichenicoccus sp.]
MTRFHAIVMAALMLHLVVLVTLGVLLVVYRRLLREARARADMSANYAASAVRQLTEANGVIRSLEGTIADTGRLLTAAQGTITLLEQHIADVDLQRDVALAVSRRYADTVSELEARLRLPELTDADLVLLDAEVRPNGLTDGPVAVPEGCRVEVMPYRPHAILRGPGGRFVQKVVIGPQGERTPADDYPVGRDRKDGWA